MTKLTNLRILPAALAAAVCLAACAKDDENNGSNSTEPDAGGMSTPDVGDMSPDDEDMTLVTEDAGPDEGGVIDSGTDDVGPDADDATDMGGPTFVEPAGQSGSRLKLRYVEGGPGAHMTVGFFDTQLDVSCEFPNPGFNGTPRCLPLISTIPVYRDSQCTEPIFRDSDIACSGTVYSSGADGFLKKSNTPALLEAGGPYVAGEFGCNSVPAVPNDEYWLAEEVPPETFVEGTFVDEDRADGLIARYVEGADGSRLLKDAFNQAKGHVCYFDDEGHCLPASAPGSYYADADCTEFVDSTEEAAIPTYVVALETAAGDPDICKSIRLYEPGMEYNGTLYRETFPGTCQEVMPDPAKIYFYRGPEASLDLLPTATVRTEGEGPLAARRLVDSEGAPLRTVHEFVDEATGEACRPLELRPAGDPDGDPYLACAPGRLATVQDNRYLTINCSDGSEIAVDEICGPDPDALVSLGPQRCLGREFFAVGDVFEVSGEVGPDYYFQSAPDSDCELRTLNQVERAWQKGASIRDSLPELAIGVEQ